MLINYLIKKGGKNNKKNRILLIQNKSILIDLNLKISLKTLKSKLIYETRASIILI